MKMHWKCLPFICFCFIDFCDVCVYHCWQSVVFITYFMWNIKQNKLSVDMQQQAPDGRSKTVNIQSYIISSRFKQLGKCHILKKMYKFVCLANNQQPGAIIIITILVPCHLVKSLKFDQSIYGGKINYVSSQPNTLRIEHEHVLNNVTDISLMTHCTHAFNSMKKNQFL